MEFELHKNMDMSWYVHVESPSFVLSENLNRNIQSSWEEQEFNIIPNRTSSIEEIIEQIWTNYRTIVTLQSLQVVHICYKLLGTVTIIGSNYYIPNIPQW